MTKLKLFNLLLLLSYGMFSIFTPFVGGNDYHEVTLFNTINNGKIGYLITFCLLFPVVFFLESLFIKYPFKKRVKICFFFQCISIFLNLIIVYYAIAIHHNRHSPIYGFTNSFYPWVTAYLWLVFLFGFWSLALSTPLNKLKFFNWPFETRAGYVEPKKWIAPRER